MESESRRLPALALAFAVLTTALSAPASAAPPDPRLDALRREAQAAESNLQWEKACELYEQLLSLNRQQPDARRHYLLCSRHANLIRRHRDPTYRQQILNRELNFAFKVYREVVTALRENYVKKAQTEFQRLFRFGLDQLDFALDDEFFRREHLPAGTKPGDVTAFRARLKKDWRDAAVVSLRDAQDQVLDVALEARKALGLKPVVTVLEFACGACSGLDEYTLYLTPAQVGEEFASLAGEFVGVGIEVVVRDRRAVIAHVLLGSPAAERGLRPGDHVTRIDKKPVDGLTEEAVNERLKGAAGTLVELEVVGLGDMRERAVVLTRQLMRLPSVIETQILPGERDGLAYCRIINFQKTTAHELDEALLELKMQGMRVLILDLRGNQGGMVAAAVQVAERFLGKGKTIATLRSDVPDQGRRFKADYPDALEIPIVVLVDGDTASAAELLAGALRDNGRATLVGQPTYGKWSIQRVLQLDTAGAGVRVTLARFFSPANKSYAAQGISPDRPVGRFLPPGMKDPALEAAIQVAVDLSFE